LLAFYLSIGLTAVSNVFYHTIQKITPSNVNPLITLSISYITATVVCLIFAPFIQPYLGFTQELKKLNWTTIGLAFAMVGLEAGYLWAYREGWNISKGALTSYVTVAMILLPIGLLFFKEKITATNLLGIGVCIAGLYLLHQR
jgi:drug/metabolite transporter (DMT)-like permease